MILPLGVSFRECREYIERHISEVYHVDPGFKLFDQYIIGIPPIAIGIENGIKIIFPYTKPCHGTYLLGIEDPGEVQRLRKTVKQKRSEGFSGTFP